MKTSDLKINIIGQIIHSKDDNLMYELKLLLNLHQSNSYSIKMSPELKEAIQESEEQIENGEYKDSQTLWKDIDIWLKEK